MIIADLHIHGPYARACSKNTTFPLLEKYAKIKGITLLGTGDLQHPIWNKEIKDNLEEDENGILWTKTKFPFIWQTEISLMYKQEKRRAVHHVVLSPNIEVSDQIIEALLKKGRIDYDGRPIFGYTSPEFVEIMKEISEDIEIIPAHAWTPWFGIFGSKSGFDTLKECFQEKTNKIYSIETGMSSDPEMNWRLPQLDNTNLVSFSDAHSYWPWRIGREATVFNIKELTYKNIIKAIRTSEGLNSTIEVDPNYGKYHFTGHRNCSVSLNPVASLKVKGICPMCKKELTVGVADRIEELAKREEGYKPENAKPFTKLIPLHELIASHYNTRSLTSKKIWEIYNKLINYFKSEFNILLNVEKEELRKIIDDKLVSLIIKNREQTLKVKPGYDGTYGEIINQCN